VKLIQSLNDLLLLFYGYAIMWHEWSLVINLFHDY